MSIDLSKYDKNTKILNLMNQNIKGVLNLIKFCFLEELYCGNNEITEIVNLRNNIKTIDCHNNHITDCNFMRTNIQYFNCANNNIEYLEYVPNIRPKKYPKRIKNINIVLIIINH